MIEQAMDTYKGLHSIISPAGILRDKMFHKMGDEEWDVVIDVHAQLIGFDAQLPPLAHWE